MPILQDMTIKRKLILITMATCVVALLLAGAIFIAWEWINLRATMVRDLSTHAKMIADNCKAAIAFNDTKDAEEILKALQAEHSIIFGCIYANNGELFEAYYRDNVDNNIHLPPFQENGYYFSQGNLTIFEPIILDGEMIGTVCLQSDLQPLYVMLRRNIIIIIIALLSVAAIAYLISSKIQKIISNPVLTLAESTAIIGKGNLNHRVKIQSKDEIGYLAAAFNDMTHKLKQSYEHLEEKVQERTAQLKKANENLQKEIIERKQAEQRQAQLLKEVERANQELKDFAYIVSHDLKAPLRGIATLVNWIASDYADKLDQDGKEQIDLLLARVDRMHNLIDGILEYSRVGRVKEKEVDVDLNELVREIIDMIDVPENITITIENELPVIKCEQTRIIQVFQNLLSNAVKYMDKPQGQIRIGCVQEDGFWRFSIADNGPGIEEKHFEKIFQIFQTLSPRDEVESTGVGLTVVKKIIELYGGKIWVESKVGEGSTFFFTLPKQKMGVEDARLQADIVSRR